MNWNEANLYCQNLKQEGHSDWRLPSKKELKGLYVASLSSSGYYWSSSMTSLNGTIGNARWDINFKSGVIHKVRESEKRYVCCVRDKYSTSER